MANKGNSCGRTCRFYRYGSTIKNKRNTKRAKKAREKRLKYQREYNKSDKEKKKRAELMHLNKLLNSKKGDGKDVSHQKDGSVRLENASKNRGAKDRTPGDKRARGVKKMQMGGTVQEIAPRNGVRTNPDGTVSTHLMAYAKVGDKFVAYPTLFQNPDGSWIEPDKGNWEAYKMAKERGEVFIFDSEQDAADFTKGSWKTQNVPKEVKKLQMGGSVFDEIDKTREKIAEGFFKEKIKLPDIIVQGKKQKVDNTSVSSGRNDLLRKQRVEETNKKALEESKKKIKRQLEEDILIESTWDKNNPDLNENTEIIPLKLADRIIPRDELNKTYGAIAEMREECKRTFNGKCLSSVLNYDGSFLGAELGEDPIRSDYIGLEEAYKKYSMPSNNVGKKLHNNSIDSWEFHKFMRNEAGYIPIKDIYSAPIGTIIGLGDSRDRYTDPNADEVTPRHSIQVIAYTDDGEPIVNDFGKVVLLTEAMKRYPDVEEVFASAPPQYAKYNFDYAKNEVTRNLNLDEDVDFKVKGDPIIKEGIMEISDNLAKETGVPKPLIEKISRMIPGLYYAESKKGESAEKKYFDNPLGNYVVKPVAKTLEDLGALARNSYKRLVENQGEYKQQDYELETEAINKYPNNKQKQIQYFNELKEKEDEKLERFTFSDNTNSSMGLTSVKFDSPLFTKLTGLDKTDLQSGIGTGISEKEALKRATQASLVILTERVKSIKKKNPNISDREAIDLAYVGYSNAQKMADPEFLKTYIQNRNNSDGVLKKIKSNSN